MFGWFRAKCPVDDDDRLWIDHRLEWLVREFGADRLLNAVVVLPTDEFFPDPYEGARDDVRPMLDRVCRYMDVDPSRVELDFYSEHRPSDSIVQLADAHSGAAQAGTVGLYEEHEGRFRVWLETSNLRDPLSVAATLAHELGHVRLLGEGRVPPDATDHEPLTDLLTVVLGLGVLTANSILRESHWDGGGWSGWSVGRQGYLTGPHFGYALALFARRRGEDRPKWAQHLRLDVKAAFRQASRFLERQRSVTAPRPEAYPQLPPGAFRPSETDDDRDDNGDEPGYNETGRKDTGSKDTEANDSESDLSESERGDFVSHGVALAYEGEFEQAIELFDRALETMPGDGEIYQFRAEAWLALERYPEALSDAATAVQLAPDNIEAHRAHGNACLGTHDYETAVSDFSRVIEEEPDDAKAYYRRGLAWAAIGELLIALTDFSQAIRHAPTVAAHYLARSRAYDELGQPDKARADRDEAEWRERS